MLKKSGIQNNINTACPTMWGLTPEYEQVQRLGIADKVKLVSQTFKAYDELLKHNVDYVETRLHGGIRALNAGETSLIIAVDNRLI